MRLKRWLFNTCIGLFILMFSLVGCNKGPQQGFPGGAAPIVVEIWHSLQGEEAETLEDQVKKITDSHPEVLVKTLYVAAEKMPTLAYQGQAGGEGPEIFISTKDALTKLYTQGALAPVAVNKPDTFPALSAGFAYGNQQFAQPLFTDVPVLYYRKDMVPAPASFNDITTSKGLLVLASPDTKTLAALWNGQGGKLLSNNQPVLNDLMNLALIQQLITLRDAKQLQVTSNAPGMFTGGTAPYMLGWASQAKALSQAGAAWGGLNPTVLSGGQGQALNTSTWGIANSSLRSTEQLLPQIKLVEEELLTPETEASFALSGNMFPASSLYYKRPEAQQGLMPLVNQILAGSWKLAGSAPEWKLIPQQDTAWRSILVDNKDPIQTLDQAQSEAVKSLSQGK